MANKDYNFQYTPLTGRLPGNSFVKQTEQAINELAGIVNEGAAQVEVITNLANQANDNSEEALEKATEALETSGRVYITLPNLEDADDYFDSQLYYFANSYSANLPVEDTGFLEVKTNDTKTACEQVFIADDTGLCYFRHGVITATEVGGETVYSVTWETWSSALASEDYVQQEVNNEAERADETFLPLSGGTMTGTIEGTGTVLKNSNDTDRMLIVGGNTDADSPNILLIPSNDDSDAGTIQIHANDGVNYTNLNCFPDGRLTWKGKNVFLNRNDWTLEIENSNPSFSGYCTNYTSGTAPTGEIYVGSINFNDKNGNSFSNIWNLIADDGHGTMLFRIRNLAGTMDSLWYCNNSSNQPYLCPASDNHTTLGKAGNRWKQLFAGTTTINTSDERLKDNIKSVPDEVLDAWEDVQWCQFQFKESLQEKGEKARVHNGLIAQRVKSVFEKHDLDAFRYGLLCYDEWEETNETKAENGEIAIEYRPAGNIYSLRYEEALCMEAAYQRRRADRLEKRIARLEKLLEVNQ